MTLFQKLYNYCYSQKPEQKENRSKLNSSILIGLDNNNEYFFEIKWDHNIVTSPDQLANIIIGLNYGLFTEEVINILQSHNGDTIDKKIIEEALSLLNKKQNILKDITETTDNSPLIKPSSVFNPS